MNASSSGDRATELRRYIDAIYAGGTVTGEDARAYAILPDSVTAQRGEFIGEVCRQCNAAATLEIGMAWGLSTLFIVEAKLANRIGDSPHIVIDPLQSELYHNAALRALREAGVSEMVEFYEAPSELVLPRLVEQGRQFDFAFIDGDHRFDGVFLDFHFIHQLLKPGGLAVFDDLRWDGVYLTCKFAETNYGYEIAGDFPSPRPGRRFGLRPSLPLVRAYRKPQVAVQRASDHFVPFFHGYRRLRGVTGNQLRYRGLRALGQGDHVGARALFLQALEREPMDVKTWLRFVRTFLPPRMARALSGRTGSTP
jgi:predicted O-methyltransferase YrrM